MNKKSPLYIILFMGIISSLLGISIASVYYTSLPIVKANEVLFLNRAICTVFDLPVASDNAVDYEKAVEEHIVRDTLRHDGESIITLTQKSAPYTVGIVFSGVGFWDRIEGIITVTKDLSTISGIYFTEQHETPGLGARIEEEWFREQFKGRKILWENPIGKRIIIGAGEKTQVNRVDAITGATQTSMAVMKSLNRSLASFKNAHDSKNGS